MRRERRDIVIIGGGSAGTAAAIAARRLGATVCIVERDGFTGGLASGAWVGTICGHGITGGANFAPVCGGWPHEFVSIVSERSGTHPQRTRDGYWYVPYDPMVFRSLATSQLAAAGVDVFLHSTCCRTRVEGRRLLSIETLLWNTPVEIDADVFVDCSGESILSTLAGLESIESEWHQTPSIVVRIDSLPELSIDELKLQLHHDLRSGVLSGTLAQELNRISIVPGSIRERSALLKMTLPTKRSGDPLLTSGLAVGAVRLTTLLDDWLRAGAHDLGSARVAAVAPDIGIRTGRRMLGRTMLTADRIIACEAHADDIALGAWPLEEWLDEREPKMTKLHGERYGIPLDALRSAHLDNLFSAGRGISADAGAIASARVIGTCLQTGWAAGRAAAGFAAGQTIADIVQSTRKDLDIQDTYAAYRTAVQSSIR